MEEWSEMVRNFFVECVMWRERKKLYVCFCWKLFGNSYVWIAEMRAEQSSLLDVCSSGRTCAPTIILLYL